MKVGEVLTAFSLISQADAIRRYSRDQPMINETLLAHVGWCATWCLFVGKKLELEAQLELDWGLLMCSCVSHDLDEIGTGDIPRTTKYANMTIAGQLHNVAAMFVVFLEKELKLPANSIYENWRNAKSKKRVEGILLAQADLAAVVYKVWDEITRHNNFAFVRVAHELRLVLLAHIENRGDDQFWLGMKPKLFFNSINEALLTIVDGAIADSSSREDRLRSLNIRLE